MEVTEQVAESEKARKPVTSLLQPGTSRRETRRSRGYRRREKELPDCRKAINARSEVFIRRVKAELKQEEIRRDYQKKRAEKQLRKKSTERTALAARSGIRKEVIR